MRLYKCSTMNTELAGIHPIAPGLVKILQKQRLRLRMAVEAKVGLVKDNVTMVSGRRESNGENLIELRLEEAVKITSKLPLGEEVEHGVADKVALVYST